MLPQANLAFGSGTRPELAGPRNSCYVFSVLAYNDAVSPATQRTT
jgi:hypothetical protein